MAVNKDSLGGKNSRWKIAKCPYCFGEFYPYGAAFRAEKIYTDNDTDNMSDEEVERVEKFVAQRDTKLIEYWKEKGYSDGTPDSSQYKDYENHIVMSFTDDQNSELIDAFEEDDDGFPNRIHDISGHASSIRVCPYCHNVLPKEYGKFPVLFIAVVGIRNSGKTVYLSQFLRYISDYLAQVNMTTLGEQNEVDRYVGMHPIRKNIKLPASTVGDRMQLPLPLTVRNRQTGKRYTMVFYDIAGENCVDSSKMDTFGPFIRNANGIMMIIDPVKQLSDLFQIDDNDVDEPEFDDIESMNEHIMREEFLRSPSRVARAMYSAFGAEEAGGIVKVPMAVALSKSDMLRPYFNNNGLDSNILYGIDYKSYGGDGRGFAYDDYMSISREVRTLLTSEGPSSLVDAIEAGFSTHDYFAFSALNTDPVANGKGDEKYYELDETPERIRLEEPLFWLLYELGMIPMLKRDGTSGYKRINWAQISGGPAFVMSDSEPHPKSTGFIGKLFGRK